MKPKIFGTTTLNVKGQAVIPIEAREALGLSSGSKMMVMYGPMRKSLVLIPIEEVENVLNHIAEVLPLIKSNYKNKEGK